MEAFVYSWSDHKTAKIYVGVHKGSQTDGYICSSKPMMAEYRERPTDFTRQIIATGTLNDCAVLEVAIIKQLLKDKAACYNRAAGKMIINDVHPMLGKTHSEQSRKKLSVAHTGVAWDQTRKDAFNKSRIGFIPWNKGIKYQGQPRPPEVREKIRIAKTGATASDATKEKMSQNRKGRVPWNKGKKYAGTPCSEEKKLALSIANAGKAPPNKGIPMSSEQKEKLKAIIAKKKKEAKNA